MNKNTEAIEKVKINMNETIQILDILINLDKKAIQATTDLNDEEMDAAIAVYREAVQNAKDIVLNHALSPTKLTITEFSKMLSDMKHATGFDELKKRKGKHVYYRNHFIGESEPLDNAVKLEFATKATNQKAVMYIITAEGLKYIDCIYGTRLATDKGD